MKVLSTSLFPEKMFSKEEAAAGKQAFWTAFGRYMRPVLGADGEPKKWMNYETGIPGLYLRIFLHNKAAFAGIEITDAESEQGARLVSVLIDTLPMLKRHTGQDWDWIPVENRPPNSLFWGTALHGKSPIVQSNWPELISFFKQNLLAMDAYWNEAGMAFE